jgi:hypothetical protein
MQKGFHAIPIADQRWPGLGSRSVNFSSTFASNRTGLEPSVALCLGCWVWSRVEALICRTRAIPAGRAGDCPFIGFGCNPLRGASLVLSKMSTNTSEVAKYSTVPPVMKPIAVVVPPIYLPCRWRPSRSCIESAPAKSAHAAKQQPILPRNRRTFMTLTLPAK